jgi:hypothetical protein
MKLRACAVLLAALGLAAPVFAQSSTAAGTAGSQNIGASGTNETTGTSNPKNVKAQGSGSGNADIGAGPNAKSSGTGGKGGTGDTARSGTGATSGAGGSHIGASGTNETAGPSHPQGAKPEGSGSGDAKRSGSAPRY